MASKLPLNHSNIMRILKKTQKEIWPTRADYHVLTYAEEGFSPLDIHGRYMGVDKAQQTVFCDQVNQRFEIGSLFPMAPISAVPRALIRDNQMANTLSFHIRKFFKVNNQVIKATKVICDFRSPDLATFVLVAVETAAQSPDAVRVEEIVILED